MKLRKEILVLMHPLVRKNPEDQPHPKEQFYVLASTQQARQVLCYCEPIYLYPDHQRSAVIFPIMLSIDWYSHVFPLPQLLIGLHESVSDHLRFRLMMMHCLAAAN